MLHYTKIETAAKILANRKVWLFEYTSLNDYSESRHFLESFVDLFAPKNSPAHGLIRDCIDSLDDIDLTGFVFSLSECDDCLSMWRGYAADGEGCSIDLDRDVLINELVSFCRMTGRDVPDVYAIVNEYTLNMIENFQAGKKSDPDECFRNLSEGSSLGIEGVPKAWEDFDAYYPNNVYIAPIEYVLALNRNSSRLFQNFYWNFVFLVEKYLDVVDTEVLAAEVRHFLFKISLLYKHDGFKEEMEWRMLSVLPTDSSQIRSIDGRRYISVELPGRAFSGLTIGPTSGESIETDSAFHGIALPMQRSLIPYQQSK